MLDTQVLQTQPPHLPSLHVCLCVCVGVHMRALIRVLLCDPTDCGPQGSCFHGNFQARILQWVLISSSWPTDWTGVSYISWTGRWVLSTSAIHTVCYWCPNRIGRGKTGTEDHALGKYLSSIYYLYGFLKPFRVALSLSLFFLSSIGVCFFLPISLSRGLTSFIFYNYRPEKLPHTNRH